ncbi:PilZ domain-containing protein [Marinobacter sp. VGCF2001]|uniref:PilZ domain-containing protein n=1 Tax=Marinobacter sp. VGCF2001 TaxID=3417189 RepID=UPI003CF00B8E
MMSDEDYAFGTESELPSGRELREDYRLTARARAWVTLESPEPDREPLMADSETVRLECQVRDISARGISLLCETGLAMGAIVAAEVRLGEHSRPFSLSVEVVWCRQADWEYLIGVRVLESDDTDYLDWIEAVATALADT